MMESFPKPWFSIGGDERRYFIDAAPPVLCAPCWEHGYCQYPDNCMASVGVPTLSDRVYKEKDA